MKRQNKIMLSYNTANAEMELLTKSLETRGSLEAVV